MSHSMTTDLQDLEVLKMWKLNCTFFGFRVQKGVIKLSYGAVLSNTYLEQSCPVHDEGQ